MTGKSIATAGGNHPQGALGAHQFAADAVDHAIAAHHEDRIHPFLNGLAGLLLAVCHTMADLVGDLGMLAA